MKTKILTVWPFADKSIVSQCVCRGLVFKNEDLDSWAVPFVGCDKSVVMRTQRYNKQVNGQEPVRLLFFFLNYVIDLKA